MISKLLITLLFPVLGFAQEKTQTADSIGRRPDLAKMAYEDIKWAKSEGNAFWFYYKPTQYFFKDNEFETISLENGDFMAYIHELQRYVLLPDYLKTEKNKERSVEPIANSSVVFIKINRGRFWIFDHGIYVDHLERVGFNSQDHLYVYRGGKIDKRYWITESDFLYGAMNTPVGIVSE